MSDFSLKPFIDDNKTIHLIGIGGVSMSALAELLISMGAKVTGSDRNRSDVTDKLSALGAVIHYEHNAKNAENASLIIRTSAVHDDNPEVIYARGNAIPVIERAQAWGTLMRDYKNVICLSGTHGKTTSTSMMSLITMEAGLDPTVMVGSKLPAIDGTLRIGNYDYFVAESCEYTNSFLSFHPTVTVILNVDADHLDFFKDIDDIITSFHRFAMLTPDSGAIVVNNDSPNAKKAVMGINKKVLTFGLTPDADVYPESVSKVNGYYHFDVMHKEKFFCHVDLSVPGRHNMQNALACCAVSVFLGIDPEATSRGLSSFTGSSRRFQLTGRLKNGAVVVDDYAHHPTEMKATLSTAREMDFKRIICVFQPHTYTRTKALFHEFVDALSLCDKAILADIYAAREQNTVNISSKDVAEKVLNAEYYGTFAEIESRLREISEDGDLIITMGAGDVHRIGEQLVSFEKPEI